ncbi:MAG: hypothetical protein SFX18_07175 [Pirellulales bacterium]|nr:hypothetical protein [Pirellulales bacterium]
MRGLIGGMILGLGLFLANLQGDNAKAEQTSVITPGGQAVVVHDRLAPVILHRISPPFRGVHQYARGRRAR